MPKPLSSYLWQKRKELEITGLANGDLIIEFSKQSRFRAVREKMQLSFNGIKAFMIKSELLKRELN